jgi:hypothetical protein
MAENKVKSSVAASLHAACYMLPFVIAYLLGFMYFTWIAYIIMYGTHFIIDRLRLAKYIQRFNTYDASKVPDYLSVWLLIIIDNTLHLTINYLSIKYL